MKLITSGVIFSAAMVRSPSFSRSSSSTTMIISPLRIASTASSIGANGDLRRLRLVVMGLLTVSRRDRAGGELDRPRHVFAEDVTFEVDRIAGVHPLQAGVGP